MQLPTKLTPLFNDARYAVAVEIKSRYIKHLPITLSLREKRLRLQALEAACIDVLGMPLERFILDS